MTKPNQHRYEFSADRVSELVETNAQQAPVQRKKANAGWSESEAAAEYRAVVAAS